MGSFIQLLLITSMPIIKFLLMTVLGVFLATKRIDILSETARHHLNQMVFYVFGPALVGSYIAQTITLEGFITMWFMPINIMLTFVIGSALGWVLGKITRAPKHMMGLVVSSCSAGNLGILPIIIIPAICNQPGSPLGAAAVCNQHGLAYASLSMAMASIYQWLYVYNIVRISSKKKVETTTADRCDGIDKQSGAATVLNIPDSERVSSSEFTQTATVDVVERLPSTHQSAAGSIDHFSGNKFMIATSFKIKQGLRNTCKNINLKAVLAPTTIAAAVGFFIGMIPLFRKLLFGKNAPLRVVADTTSMIRDAAIPLATLIIGANLLKGLKGSRVKLTIILGIIVVRYIILPLLGILVLKGAVRAGFVQSHDILLQFVILLQYALPPSVAIATITQLFGEGESECSVIMLWTYVVAPATVTLWCTFFLWLLSH
ncbi:protein PIN-LIKES 3-like [Silene latifolia]|uniref:protein PIN-LIKES 3-like n=1 Tax=Silene latifolia TaxID=37657 RepID=UPI003D77B482